MRVRVGETVASWMGVRVHRPVGELKGGRVRVLRSCVGRMGAVFVEYAEALRSLETISRGNVEFRKFLRRLCIQGPVHRLKCAVMTQVWPALWERGGGGRKPPVSCVTSLPNHRSPISQTPPTPIGAADTASYLLNPPARLPARKRRLIR